MLTMKNNWGILFMKDGLDVNWMTNYLNSVEGTKVVKTVEDTVKYLDGSGGAEDVVLYCMETDGIFIPMKFKLELNLKTFPEHGEYLYFPV